MAEDEFDELMREVEEESAEALEELRETLEKVRRILKEVKDGDRSIDGMSKDEAVAWLEEVEERKETLITIFERHNETAAELLDEE